MTKSDYRSFFANVRPFVKFNYFCKMASISPVNFSRFMKGEGWNYEVSEDKLRLMYDIILEHFQKFA